MIRMIVHGNISYILAIFINKLAFIKCYFSRRTASCHDIVPTVVSVIIRPGVFVGLSANFNTVGPVIGISVHICKTA